jgi:pilus assembly protein CpaE
MSRTALVIGDAVERDANVTATLARFGVDEIVPVPEISVALDLLSQRHVDVVFVAVESLTEPLLAQLDRTIRREQHTDVIGTAPKADPEVMLRAMRAGIQEFLVRPVNPTELAAALERQNRRSKAGGTSGSVFACYSAKGGMGVSSIAANLAAALASTHKAQRVAVADLVIPNGEQRLHFNASVAYDIGEVATKPDRLDQELLNSVLAPVRDGIWLLASSEDPEVDEMVDADHDKPDSAATAVELSLHGGGLRPPAQRSHAGRARCRRSARDRDAAQCLGVALDATIIGDLPPARVPE